MRYNYAQQSAVNAYARKILDDGRIIAVDCFSHERVVRFRFNGGDVAGRTSVRVTPVINSV